MSVSDSSSCFQSSKMVWNFSSLLPFLSSLWLLCLYTHTHILYFYTYFTRVLEEIVLAMFCCCCSVAKLCPTLCDHMDCSTPGFPVLQCTSLSPRVCLNLGPLSQWCNLTILSSCLQSFPVSGSFLMSQLFAAGGQGIGASASVLPMNIQSWFSLGLTGLISLLSKGLSSVLSSTTIQKHQFFDSQSSLWSKHIHTWLLEKP